MPYELVSGDCLRIVQAYCRHLTHNGIFNDATYPSLEEVTIILAQSQADLKAQLMRYGYPTDQSAMTDDGVLWLESANATRAAMKIELTYPITSVGEPNERFKQFAADWKLVLDTLKGKALAAIFGGEGLSAGLELTGTSKSKMLARESETDRVAGRVPRDFGANPRVSRVPPVYTMEDEGYQ